jgi:C-methyltransferase C-terminal domain
VFLQHAGARPVESAVADLANEESAAGLTSAARYAGFSRDVQSLCADLVALLRRLRAEGRRLAAYGAPAKGTVLLNACGIGPDLLEFTVDRSPHKQGRLIPGVRLPIRAPEALLEGMPDFTLLLPWNIADEIVEQQAAYLRRGGAFILPVPAPQIVRA